MCINLPKRGGWEGGCLGLLKKTELKGVENERLHGLGGLKKVSESARHKELEERIEFDRTGVDMK